MRKIIANLFITVDGVVEAPEQWSFPYFNEQVGAAVGAGMAAADTMLLGRVTYDHFAAYWPRSEDEGAQFMNDVAKVVVSTTLDKADWTNSTLISGNVVEEITKLKQQEGKDISISGSITLVRSLLCENLLDELVLLVSPIVVGHGTRLFDGFDAQVPLQLTRSETFDNGVLSLAYAPVDK